MLKRVVKLVLFVLFIVSVNNGYCLNLDKVKINFLNGDYKAAALEGERLLAQEPHSDELYYLLGLIYLKDGNFLRASDIFEIILREFPDTRLKDEATLGLGDSYFLRGELDDAEACYKNLSVKNTKTKLKAQAYQRLSQIAFKKGDTESGKDYLDKLKQEFPLGVELKEDKDLFPVSYSAGDISYTVQVGSFSSKANAENLTQRLTRNGYPAYLEESASAGQAAYRVRVGKFSSRKEAVDSEEKLSREGFPTKIYP